MRVIIHNADDTQKTWECLRVAYADFVQEESEEPVDCEYRFKPAIVYASRGKRDITLTVQAHQPKAKE